MKKNNFLYLSKKKKFADLISENIDNLYKLAYMRCKDRELAEDLVQDACLKAYNSYIAKDEIQNPKAWLNRILINTHIDYTRKKQPQIIEIEHLDFVDKKDPSKEAELSFFYKHLHQALLNLDEEQRIVVYLSDVKEYTYKEISEILEIPIGTVMSRLHRARQSLRTLLIELGYSKGVVKSGGSL